MILAPKVRICMFVLRVYDM